MTENKIAELLEQREWHQERKRLREILLEFQLIEEIKWGKLCFTHAGSNVAIFYGMKDYCAIGFFKGALLEDDDGLLVAPGKNSQAMRQLRFNSLDEINACTEVIRSFIEKAIRAELEGLEVDFSAKRNLSYPAELQDAFDADPPLAKAFAQLTPGRQRGFVLYISDAKRTETRKNRIEKSRPKIIAGKGPNEP